MYVKVIASHRWDVFLRHSVVKFLVDTYLAIPQRHKSYTREIIHKLSDDAITNCHPFW